MHRFVESKEPRQRLTRIGVQGHTKATAENDDEAHRHTMLRPRHWWDAKFMEHGAVPNKEMLWAMQEKDTSFTRCERIHTPACVDTPNLASAVL
jgi:hypothetical protein